MIPAALLIYWKVKVSCGTVKAKAKYFGRTRKHATLIRSIFSPKLICNGYSYFVCDRVRVVMELYSISVMDRRGLVKDQ